MSVRIDKVLERCRFGGVISFREFERLLEAHGFRLARTAGSHRIYRHPALRRSLSVQPDGEDAKVYQVRMLLGMIDEFELRPKGDE